MHGAKGNAGGIAMLEGDDARREIAAEAVAHHHDLGRVDVCPRGDVVVSRGAGDFVVGPAVNLAQPQRFALPWPVDRERVDATLRKLEAGEDDAHLLAIVHAVEQHDGRRAAGDAGRLHEIGGERSAFVRHVDPLDLRIEAFEGRVPAAQRLPIDGELLLGRRHEALTGIVVVARPHVVVAGGDGEAFGRRGIATPRHTVGHRDPFLPPRAVGITLAGACRKPRADPVDLFHRDRARGGHSFDDLHRIGPPQIAGKMLDPGSAPHFAAHAHIPPTCTFRPHPEGRGSTASRRMAPRAAACGRPSRRPHRQRVDFGTISAEVRQA